jgi:phage-related protein (TIGR01555 family)
MNIKTLTSSDGWKSILTGILSKKDKRSKYNFTRIKMLDRDKWILYENDLMLKKIINLIPDTALKDPIALINNNSDKLQVIHNFLDKIDFHKNLTKIWRYSRLLGGGFILLDIQDGRTLDKEVNYQNIRNISISKVLTKEYAYMKKEDSDFMFTYNYYQNKDNKIHKSRILFLEGEEISEEERWSNNGWGGSIVDSIVQDLYYYNLVHEVPSILLVDFSKPVWKLKGLNQKVVTNEADIKKRMDVMDYVSSIVNAVVLDSEDDFQRVGINVTGVDKLMYQTERKLVQLSRIPHTLLLGEAPEGGLSNSGKQQQQDFYDFVDFERNYHLTKPIKQFLYLLENMFNLSDPLDFEFANLFKLDDKEQAQRNKTRAEAQKLRLENIIKLVDFQIISIEEARNLIMKEDNMIDDESRKILNEGSWS